jgi:predicted TIM-barrel fold metal-dependent hydrolase
VIIDLHRHMWSVFERYSVVADIAARSGVAGHTHFTAPAEDVEGRVAEIRGEMERAGVDRSCLILGDYGLRIGEGDRTIEEENALQTDLARADERFIAFAGVDPRRDDAAALCRASLEAGARGIKLHPGAGFSPSDPCCRPLYELAGEYSVPVAIHTGPTAAPLISTYSSPLEVDEPAADYPDVDFILLHAGQRAWFQLALDLAWWKPNIYLELSLWQTLLLEDEAGFMSRLREIKGAIGLDRVLFGSDCPGISKIMDLTAWVEVFRALPESTARHGFEVSAGEVEEMLGGTAARLLGVEG